MTTRVAGFQPVPAGAPQLASFFRGLWVVLGAFAIFSGAAFLTGGRPISGTVAILLAVATGSVLVATRVLAAGLIRPAVLLASVTLLGLLLVVGLVLPIEAEAAVGVLLAVAAGLPYLQGRALGGLMIAAWVVGVVIVVAPRVFPDLQAGAPTTDIGATAAALSIAVALGLFLYVLWQHSRRLRGAIVDAEREHRAAQLLLQERSQLAAIVDSAEDAIISATLDGTILTWNAGAERLYGWSAAEVVGTSLAPTYPPEMQHQIADRLALMVAGERSLGVETERMHRDGRRLKVSVSLAPILDEAGRTMGVSGITRDITAQRNNRDALARSEALLAAAEVIANLGSFEVDLTTGRVRWSDHLYRMADIEPGAELDYEGFLAVVHPEDRPRVRATIEDAIGRRVDHAYEFRVPRKDSTERVLSCQARVVSDNDGRPVRIFGTAQDITDARRLEHEFRQAQKMEAVGRLAGGIAHDFNNALTAIIGYGQILAETLEGKPEAEWVGQIEGAARHAAGLTRQLLAFSRRQVLQPEVLDVAALVEELAPMLRLMIGNHVELVTTVEPETCQVLADPGQLQQVLLNLAGNARDAMPDGGRMTISLSNAGLDAVKAATLGVPPGSYVALTVEDDGQGMDDATKARIFEPFFTTKEVGKGTGLGLAMVHGVVTQSGGHISFESELGRGTRFRIILPSVGSAPLPAPYEAPVPTPGRLTGRVLVVEDEPMLRELTRLTLEANGLTVVEASDAERGLEELARSPFDLVISDVVMPGSGGGALVDGLRARGSAIPIIFMSGYPRDEVVARGVSESEYPYLAKPFRPSQLIALVRKTLQAKVPAAT